MEFDKSKLAIAVAVALGLAAVAYVVYENSVASQSAQASDSGGQLPTLLYTTGNAGATQLPVGSSSVDTSVNQTPAPSTSETAILSSMQGMLAQIEASKNVAYNATASDLFSKLPEQLGTSNISDFTAMQSQDAEGKTLLETHATYRSSATPIDSARPLPFRYTTRTINGVSYLSAADSSMPLEGNLQYIAP